MHVRAFASKLLSESDATLVHESRVPRGCCSQPRRKDAGTIRTPESGWPIRIANSWKTESRDAADLSDAGRAGLLVTPRHDTNLLFS